MTQDKALQRFEASFYLDREIVQRALAVLSGNGDATSTVGAMLRDMERMALDLRRLHIESERLRAELGISQQIRSELLATLQNTNDRVSGLMLEAHARNEEFTHQAAEAEPLRTALRQILEDPEALILNSHRDDAWAALGEVPRSLPE